jgi:Rrf2 family cysteine metabolism transcriptional repressor
VEGPVAVVHCTLPCPDEDPACRRVNRCATHLLWNRVSEAVAEVLDSFTLRDLADEAVQLADEEWRGDSLESTAVTFK